MTLHRTADRIPVFSSRTALRALLCLGLAACDPSSPTPSGGGGGTGDGGLAGLDGSTSGEDAATASPTDASMPLDGGPSMASPCAPLPPPTGTVVNVDPSMATELPALVAAASPGTTFLLADGTYRMTGSESQRRIQILADGVTLRSASGRATQVILDGEYTTAEVVSVQASNVTLAELTVMRAVDHCVHVTTREGGADVTGFTMHGAGLIDCGEQFLKVNPNGARSAFVDRGTVSCSHFELTDAGRPNVERAVGGCYTGGIDAHATRDWVVRDNEFRGIYCAGEGLAEHAIHFWKGARDTVVERNRIVDCARGIGLGLGESGETRTYADDPYPGLFVGHYGGILRNNILLATVPWYDTGIELQQARDALVVHNTILETAGATGSFSSIDTRFDNSITTVRNNITRRITVRSGTSTADHNLEGATASLFVAADAGDLHLAESAAAAIDQGIPVAEATDDVDREPRSDGAPDLGADER